VQKVNLVFVTLQSNFYKMSGEDVLGARKTIERLKISKVEPKKKKLNRAKVTDRHCGSDDRAGHAVGRRNRK
jgi:hypothetical protein